MEIFEQPVFLLCQLSYHCTPRKVRRMKQKRNRSVFYKIQEDSHETVQLPARTLSPASASRISLQMYYRADWKSQCPTSDERRCHHPTFQNPTTKIGC